MGIYRNANEFLMQGIMCLLLIALLVACQSLIPATTPPQLQHTAGAPLTITDTHIDANWFSVDYPDGWRVVTGVAIEPISLVLVAPDDTFIIRVADARAGCPIPPTPDSNRHQRTVCIGEVGAQVVISGDTAPATRTRYDTFFEMVVNSVIITPTD
ncbi:MAG: hypothetical protein ACFE0Q_01845 [Anaerolineae bacterium]